MIYYVFTLIALHLMIIGNSLDKSSREQFESLFAFLLYLPLFGRILGWF